MSADQSFSPVRASRAKALPSTSPAKMQVAGGGEERRGIGPGGVEGPLLLAGERIEGGDVRRRVLAGSSLCVPANQPSPSFTSSMFFFSTFRCEQISSAVVYHKPVRGL